SPAAGNAGTHNDRVVCIGRHFLPWILGPLELSLVRYVRHATVVSAGNDFEALFFGEADFGGVVAVNGDALEDVPEIALELLVAILRNGIAMAHPGGSMSGGRLVVHRAKQRRLLIDGSVVEGFAEKLDALFVNCGETLEESLALVFVSP